MDRVGIAGAQLVVLVVLRVELLPRRGDFGDPGGARHLRHLIGERFERGLLAADNPEIDRQVAADVFVRRIDADEAGVGSERELADRRHAVLTDEQHDVGAGQRGRRGVGRERMVVGKLALHRPRLDDRNLRAFGEPLESLPAAAVEDAVARHDHRPLGGAKHRHRRGDVLGRGMWPAVGAVAGLVEVIGQLAGILEARGGDLRRKVEMHRTRDAAAQLTEGVGGVLVHAARRDQPLAVLLHPLGGRLLVGELDAGLGVLLPDRHVAGDDEQRGARGVGAGDPADHVGEAGAFGARRHRNLAGDPDEGIGGVGHRPFVAARVGGDAARRDGVDDPVVARATEQRGDTFVLAGARKHLRAGHRELDVGDGGAGAGVQFIRNLDSGWSGRGGSGGSGRAGSGGSRLVSVRPAVAWPVRLGRGSSSRRPHLRLRPPVE